MYRGNTSSGCNERIPKQSFVFVQKTIFGAIKSCKRLTSLCIVSHYMRSNRYCPYQVELTSNKLDLSVNYYEYFYGSSLFFKENELVTHELPSIHLIDKTGMMVRNVEAFNCTACTLWQRLAVTFLQLSMIVHSWNSNYFRTFDGKKSVEKDGIEITIHKIDWHYFYCVFMCYLDFLSF